MASEDAKKLRAEVQRKLKSVNAKIARTKRNTGANIEGSQFDPRRRAGIEKNYNARQLNSYLNELSSFMRRTNQFVAGQQGPIRRGKMNLYKKIEDEYNAAGKAHHESMDNIVAPSGFTLQQERNLVVGTKASPKYGPYMPYNREPGQIVNDAAIDKLIASMNKALKVDYLSKSLRKSKEVLIDTLTKMEEPEMINAINQMSEYQFDVLWNGTNFAEGTFLKYLSEQSRLTGKQQEKWQEGVIDSVYNELGELLDWAGSTGQYNGKTIDKATGKPFVGVPRDKPDNSSSPQSKKAKGKR
jgi:hypothetical protein